MDRAKFIGGSDAGAVLGVSPWRSAYDVWLDKTGQREDDRPANPAREKVLTRGKRLEPVVIDMLTDETGLQIVHRNRRYLDPEHSFLACEIDAESATGTNVEIKTVHPFAAREWGEEDTDSIPVHYTAQVMHGLMITGRHLCIVAALVGADDLRVYRVERDDDAIAALRDAEVRFWREHVEPRIAPPPQTLDDLAKVYRVESGSVLSADDALASAVSELRDVKRRLGELSQQSQALERAIKTRMGEHAVVVDSAGRKIASWKSQSQARIDTTALAAAHPDIAQQFRATTTSRVFRIH